MGLHQSSVHSWTTSTQAQSKHWSAHSWARFVNRANSGSTWDGHVGHSMCADCGAKRSMIEQRTGTKHCWRPLSVRLPVQRAWALPSFPRMLRRPPRCGEAGSCRVGDEDYGLDLLAMASIRNRGISPVSTLGSAASWPPTRPDRRSPKMAPLLRKEMWHPVPLLMALGGER
ncbi:hypothetical protein EJ06DRAFT_161076 [Trichodelitschia bisporula]|uniref:Uncharacterized protein n=1 Tax=Trichodelitschia bisporula TaxID=703511 RepID=A0A6G1HMW9_9PEZI|nr:hypothetical protein EJ06DRAFT_161076 [Trichodelitschia bisporula]